MMVRKQKRQKAAHGPLGVRLRALRTAAGLSQVALADKIDVTGALIHAIESGCATSDPTVVRLAEVLGADLQELRQLAAQQRAARLPPAAAPAAPPPQPARSPRAAAAAAEDDLGLDLDTPAERWAPPADPLFDALLEAWLLPWPRGMLSREALQLRARRLADLAEARPLDSAQVAA